MHIESFHYHYSISGNKGGLFSIDFDFRPFDADTVTEREDMKRVTRENFDRLCDLLDGIISNNKLKCAREPIFIDSPSSSRGGYKYTGRTAGSLLPAKMPQTIESSVTFSMDKRLNDISINARCQLTHEWNLKALDAVLALPDISIGNAAQRNLNALRKLTQNTADTDTKIRHLLND